MSACAIKGPQIKMPPLEKIPEAYSAIADKRIAMSLDQATVSSSDYKKTYLVEWVGDTYSSNDNATYWQGYPGYPIIAALLLQGRLPYFPEDVLKFKGIDWNQLNTAHKNNYASALADVMHRLTYDREDAELLNKHIIEIHQALAQLNLTIKRGRIKAARV